MEERDRIVLATLPHVAFDGWSMAALRRGAEDAGGEAEAADRAFMGGAPEAVEHFIDLADRRMADAMQGMDADGMGLSAKVEAAVMTRLEQWAADREAVRRGLSLMALPGNAPRMLKATYRTVDSIWWAVGDTASDFSFYTKRASLAAIYSATLLYWLEDDSEDFSKTRDFLRRRINLIKLLPKARSRMRARLETLPRPDLLFKGPRGPGSRRGSRRGMMGFGSGHPQV